MDFDEFMSESATDEESSSLSEDDEVVEQSVEKASLQDVTNLTMRKHNAQEALREHPGLEEQAATRVWHMQEKTSTLRGQLSAKTKELQVSVSMASTTSEVEAPSPLVGRRVTFNSDTWQIVRKDWSNGVYLLKKDATEMWVGPQSFTVMPRVGDQVNFEYEVEVEVPTEVRKELKKAMGVVVEGSECDSMCIVRLDDREMHVSRLSVEVCLPREFRFPVGAVVGLCTTGLGRILGRCENGVIVAFGVESKQLSESNLLSEKAWWNQHVLKLQGESEKLALKLKSAEEEQQAAIAELERIRSLLPDKMKALETTAKALSKAKHTLPLKVVALVRFKGRSQGKCKAECWRDVGKYVEQSWSVALELGEERPVVLTLADCRGMARSVQNARQGCSGPTGAHIISAKGKKLRRCPGRITYLLLTKKVAKQILRLLKVNANGPPPLHSFSLLKAALGVVEGVVLDERVQAFFDSPEIGLIRVKQVDPPEHLKGVLRPYQLLGYRWLVNNTRNGLGCILADDMGLGKTLQAIALMIYMKQNGMLQKPMLVVVPKGLLSTWQRELTRWADGLLTVHSYAGNQRQVLPGMEPEPTPMAPPKRMRLNSKQKGKALYVKQRQVKVRVAESTADVFLTSYGTFRSDAQKLSIPGIFSGMLLDEAQQIKNYKTQVTKAVKEVAEVVGPVRISLSGTPVENRLHDLNSQFEFILPGYLASSRVDFQRSFGGPLTSTVRRMRKAAPSADEEEICRQQENLQRLVKPFLLRRLKTDPEIAPDLPAKIEKDVECELTASQRRMYAAIQETCLKETRQAKGKFERHGQVFRMLHALREACNHPCLVAESRRPSSEAPSAELAESGKCLRLMELLEEIFEQEPSGKLIIFFNYLGALRMLKEHISSKFKKEVLSYVGDMDVKSRQVVEEKFQTDPKHQILLLSLQAGGVGLTLTAASHVIHFDRQYNPAKEAQATDRAHRIGQTKTVIVHKLITKDTFEEKLNMIMQEKQRLSDITIRAGEEWIADLDDGELRSLFALSG